MRKLISSGWHQSQAQYNCRAVRKLHKLIDVLTTDFPADRKSP